MIKSTIKIPVYARIFQFVVWLIIVVGIVAVPYWMFFASDRYLSIARVLLQKTDQLSSLATADIAGVVSGSSGPNKGDQLLLREYLLSVDMLKILDKEFGLKAHYSNEDLDFVSRMWSKDPQIERFYDYWLSRVEVIYDDYSGVLNINVEAYNPELAKQLVTRMITDGEAHMNKIAHELAEVQVQFLAEQVSRAHGRLLQASRELIEFQNKQGLVSPKEQIAALNMLISKLEAQRTDIQTQLDALPRGLNSNHPTILMLKNSLKSLDQQIGLKRDELTSPARKTLNYTVEEFQRLEMELGFIQDVYKTALSGLELGRTDASRTLKKISVFQSPTLPDFPLAPNRPYNVLVSILIAAVLASIVQLMASIIRDHAD